MHNSPKQGDYCWEDRRGRQLLQEQVLVSLGQFAALLQGYPATVMIRKGKLNMQDCPSRQFESPWGTRLRWGRSCAPDSFFEAVSWARFSHGVGCWWRAFQERNSTKWDRLPALTAAPKGTWAHKIIQVGRDLWRTTSPAPTSNNPQRGTSPTPGCCCWHAVCSHILHPKVTAQLTLSPKLMLV